MEQSVLAYLLILVVISARLCFGEVSISTADGLQMSLDSSTGKLNQFTVDGTGCLADSKPMISIETVDLAKIGPNVFSDGGFETNLKAWSVTGIASIDEAVFHRGRSSLRLDHTSLDASGTSITTAVNLDQREAKPIVLTGFSRAKLASGSLALGIVNFDMAVGASLVYQDGSTEDRCQTAYLPQYDHNWTKLRSVICPDKPVKTLHLTVFMRSSKAGSLWLDDFAVRESRYVTSLLQAPIECIGNVWTQQAELVEAGVRVWVTYRPKGSHIEIQGEIENTSESDKSVTARVSLPIAANGGKWWKNGRVSAKIGPSVIYDSFWYGAGRTGYHSMYPWSCVEMPNGKSISLGVSIDEPQIFRLLYNGYSNSYNAEFDLGLAHDGPRPNRSSFTAIVYRTDSSWAFRDATDRYYSIYPWAFEKRVTKEGSWVPFYAIQDIPQYSDFGVQFNESTQDFAWEARQGLTPLTYIEPAGTHTMMYLKKDDLKTPQAALDRAKELLDGKRGINSGWQPRELGRDVGWYPKDSWVYDAAAGIVASAMRDAWGNAAGFGAETNVAVMNNASPFLPPASGYHYNAAQVELKCVESVLNLKGKYHLDGWDPLAFDHGPAYSIEVANPHFGEQCIKIGTEPHYNHWSPWWRGVKQPVNLSQPVVGPIEIEFWVRGEGVVSGKVQAMAQFRWEDGQDESFKVVADDVNGEWRRYSSVITPKKPVSFCLFTVNLRSFEGQVCIDDVRFGPPGTAENWLANGSFEKGGWIDGKVSGVYLDTLECSQGVLNNRREQFPYLRTNLTFDWSRNVVQPHIFGSTEFTREISSRLRREGKLLMANACPLFTPFSIPYVDIGGQEEEWIPGGKWSPKSDESFNWVRSMCATKPYCMLLLSRGDKEMVRKQIARCAFYGVFPSFGMLVSESNPKVYYDYYWNQDKREQDRPTWKKYMPAIQTIAKAGWKPKTYARSSNQDIWLERYGSVGIGGCYLSAFNPKEANQNTVVTIDRAALGLTGAVRISALLNDFVSITLPEGESSFNLNAEPEDTVVVSISSSQLATAKVSQ